MANRNRNPLRITTTADGELQISIGLGVLTDALNAKLADEGLEISDGHVFIKEFINVLESEEDQEDSLLGRFLDSAAAKVADRGSLAIEAKLLF